MEITQEQWDKLNEVVLKVITVDEELHGELCEVLGEINDYNDQMLEAMAKDFQNS